MKGRHSARHCAGIAIMAAMLLAACENLPGTQKEQGAVAGGAAGAAIGEAATDDALGTLLGGALGAASGYLVGGNYDRLMGGERNRQEAIAAGEQARREPVTAEDVEIGGTADINDNGYVTMDELIAMENAGLSDQAMLDRLRQSDQVYMLSQQQRERLVEAGLSRSVVDQLEDINRDQRERLLSERSDVISEPAN